MVPGDCDNDGTLTSADAWCALEISVGNIPEKPWMKMEPNRPGGVTARDATIILQRVVGL